MEKLNGDRDFLHHQIEEIQDATIDGIFTINNDGDVMSTNEAACQMFGFEEAELLQKSVH